jgi:hypothetical protein
LEVRDCGVRVSDFGFLSDFGDRAFGLSSPLHRFSHPVLITPASPNPAVRLKFTCHFFLGG